MLAPSRGLYAAVPDSCPISMEMPLIDWRIEVIHTLMHLSGISFLFSRIRLSPYLDILNILNIFGTVTVPFSFAHKIYIDLSGTEVEWFCLVSVLFPGGNPRSFCCTQGPVRGPQAEAEASRQGPQGSLLGMAPGANGRPFGGTEKI